jgi:hypothetical protein
MAEVVVCGGSCPLFVVGRSSTGASGLCHRQGVLLMAQTALVTLIHTFIYIVLSVSPCFLILIEVIREDEFNFRFLKGLKNKTVRA